MYIKHMDIWLWILGAVVLVSAMSLIGIVTLFFRTTRLNKILFVLVAFAAGSLLGNVFFHLLPEFVEKSGLGLQASGLIILGIVLMLVVQKFVQWHHCHNPGDSGHTHSFAIMNLVGDGLHNFIDGVIIAASFLVSIPVGIATTIAVILHEIPQEIADFGVLLQGGFKKSKALLFNFLSAATSVLGAVLTIALSGNIENIESLLIPVTIGAFIYIAGSDLIPELHKEVDKKKSFIQLAAFIAGVIIMMSLLLLE